MFVTKANNTIKNTDMFEEYFSINRYRSNVCGINFPDSNCNDGFGVIYWIKKYISRCNDSDIWTINVTYEVFELIRIVIFVDLQRKSFFSSKTWCDFLTFWLSCFDLTTLWWHRTRRPFYEIITACWR